MANISPTRGRRSQAESVRTRARILDRAERLFARKGSRGVSLRGKDVTDPRLKRRTKQHLKTVILALVESRR